MNLGPQHFGNSCHTGCHRRATTDGMVHAKIMFQIGENREQAGALKGRHAEVLRLKCESQTHSGVAEITAKFTIDAGPWSKPRKQANDTPTKQIPPTVKGHLQARPKSLEFPTIFFHELHIAGGISRGKSGDFVLHALNLRGNIQRRTVTVDQPVQRIEANEFDLVIEIPPDTRENLTQDARVQEKRRSQIEAEALQVE